jgi:hypothetical protein
MAPWALKHPRKRLSNPYPTNAALMASAATRHCSDFWSRIFSLFPFSFLPSRNLIEPRNYAATTSNRFSLATSQQPYESQILPA